MGGCEEVIRAVAGLRASNSLHWLNVSGIVDGDGRTDEEKSSLRSRGILTLPVNEIENLLYSTAIIESVAARQAESMGESVQTLIDRARDAALAALDEPGIPEQLADDLALKVLHRSFLNQLPNTVDRNGAPTTVTLPSPYPAIHAKIRKFLAAGDLDGLVQFAPIRNSRMRGQVAKSLLFQHFTHYQAAARAQIERDLALADGVRRLVGQLP
jgi:hypothetical protein